MKKNKTVILLLLLAGFFSASAQNSTFSPYSRYGLGEMAPATLSHNQAMGGAYIALRPDSLAPIFINNGNAAAYSLIKLTSLEIGARYMNTAIRSGSTSINRWGVNFMSAALGFPIRNNGGACLGISPYSYVGYETQSTSSVTGVGDVTNKYFGEGGLSKAYIGYGFMPFYKRLVRFRQKYLYIPDSMKYMGRGAYRSREFGSKLLSDLSIGFNANYLFGNIDNVTRVVYPNSLLYNNTLRQRTLTLGDFTGNWGAQTAITIDSAWNHKGRKLQVENAMKQMSRRGAVVDSSGLQAIIPFTATEYDRKRDSVMAATPLHRRALREKVKFTFGYYMGLNNRLKALYSTAGVNYILNGSGQEIVRDTAYKSFDNRGYITLPLEQGVGIGFKKGERLNVVADFAITNWQNFRYLNDVNDFKDNYRVAIGLSYVPEKYAGGRGSYFRRINYRFGAAYNTGHITVNNTVLSDYSVSAGLGLPVGANRFVWSMVNVSVQYGQLGLSTNNTVKENYFRVNFGFTFSDRWFQKFRYD